MKILKLSPYFYPEQVSSSHLTNDLNEAYAKAGFIQENYVPMPSRGVSDEVRKNYKDKKMEVLNDGSLIVYRFPMIKEGTKPLQRALKYVLTNIVQFHKGKKAKDIDVIFGASTPPTQGMLCAKVKKTLSKKYGHNVPFVFNLQDVFPDSLVLSGMAKKGSLIWHIGRMIENYTYSNADRIIVISNDIRDNIMAKGVEPNKIIVIPNWVDSEAIYPVPRERNRLFDEYNVSRDQFIVVYAGTMGALQGTDIIIKAAEQIEDREIHFMIFGGGAEYEKVKKYVSEHNLNNITITDLLPPDRVSEVYSMGDIALITCKSGVGKAGMPSKTWSIMSCNTPIIASFDQDSELARVLARSKAGICIPPDNTDALVKSIIQAKRTGYSSEGRNYVISYADKNVCTKGYVDVIKSVIRECGVINEAKNEHLSF